MSRMYDDWERLVASTLKREQFRQLALALSRESSFSSIQSDFSFDPPLYSDSGNLLQQLPETLGILYLVTPSYLNERLNGSHLAEADGPLSPDIQHIALKELKKATKNLRFGLWLGNSYGRGCRRWVDEHTLLLRSLELSYPLLSINGIP